MAITNLHRSRISSTNKDCSRKVRSAFRTKAMNGAYTGGYPAFGYSKSLEDRHKLMPDKFAPIVQKIFQMALEGTTVFHIAKYLEAEKIPTPRAYLMDTEGKYVANERVKHPYSWATTTVHQILSNMSSFTKKARSAKAFAE